MLKEVENNLIDLNNESDAAWFFMEWCNRPDAIECFRNEENNEIMKTIVWNLKEGFYDFEKFVNAMMKTERFKREYDEFKDMVDNKGQLADMKINDIIENEYENL